MKLDGNKIYNEEGRLLKTLSCPFDLQSAGVNSATEKKPSCTSCNKQLFNADYFTEADLERLLDSDNEVCLVINPFNPMFKRCSK